MLKTKSDALYDQMILASSADVARAAMTIMNQLQHISVPNQILGAATVMVLMEELSGVRTIEALNVADNIITDEGNYSDFQGIKAYMKNMWNI